jgi:hypothetical protein
MMEENKMHGGTCNCNGCTDGGMMGHIGRKNRHRLLKFVVVLIFMFMAFCLGVQFGEIKGALGITPFSHYRGEQQQMKMMYGNQAGGQMVPTGMMQY